MKTKMQSLSRINFRKSQISIPGNTGMKDLHQKTIKVTVFLLGAVLMSFSPGHPSKLKQGQEINSILKPGIIWKKTEINLGEILQNKPVTIEFEFTNTGDAPIIITSVKAACGCTATDYSQTPVAPGESTKIKATFNAATKGTFNKYVTVTTSAEELPKTLIFTGTVI